MSSKRFNNRYGDIAVFHSSDYFDQNVMNAGSGMFFLPGVQDFDFSFDIKNQSSLSIGTKKNNITYAEKAPDISLNISVLENFETIFSDIFESNGEISTKLNSGKNFYFLVSNDERRTALSRYESSISIGNAFVDSVNLKQSVGGVLSSTYRYNGSNIIAQEFSGSNSSEDYLLSSGLAPSVNRTGDQTNVGNFLFTGVFNERIEANFTGEYTPGRNTFVKISGIDTQETFLIKPDNIQSFDINLNFNSKPIYSVGKFYPMGRRATTPFLGNISIENKFSDIVKNDSSLNDFLNKNTKYIISISGDKINGKNFLINISDAEMSSKSINGSFSDSFIESSSFVFSADKIAIVTSKDIALWNRNNGTIWSHNDFIWDTIND
tara:strand:+ start:1344 stop:2480 length:1137 start_codon:yes stop_codon:yes gene_type:complete